MPTRIQQHKTSVSENLTKYPDYHMFLQQTKILHTNVNHWKSWNFQQIFEIQRKKQAIKRDQGFHLPGVYSTEL